MHCLVSRRARSHAVHDPLRWRGAAVALTQRARGACTLPLYALQKVEVAHIGSYQRRASAFSASAAASAVPGAVSEGAYGSSTLHAAAADDTAGPLATKNNSATIARSLGGSPAAAESFFFHRSHGKLMLGDAHIGPDSALRHDGADAGRGDQQGRHHGVSLCALCREEIDPAIMSPRQHIVSDTRASHTNHNCREVVMDSLALLASTGYPIDNMYDVWSTVLLSHPLFPRVKEWVSPTWTIEQRAEVLSRLLLALKDAGVIDISLAGVAPDTQDSVTYHHRRRVAFERMEYIGDNAWGTHISSRMMVLFPDQQWQYSERAYSFNCFRDAAEMNVTSEIIFDELHLVRLLPASAQAKVGSGKAKADMVEALVGELHLALWGYQPQLQDDVAFVEVNGDDEASAVSILEHCLNEMYDLIILNYCRELSWHAVPLAKELAASRMWAGVRPRVRSSRSVPRRASGAAIAVGAPVGSAVPSTPSLCSRGTAESGSSEPPSKTDPAALAPIALYGPTCVLPALPQLFPAAQAYPARLENPVRALPVSERPPDVRSSFTGAFVFEGFVSSYRRLGLLNDDAMQVYHRVNDSQTRWDTFTSSLVPSLSGALGLPLVAGTAPLAGLGGAGSVDFERGYFRDPYFSLLPAPQSAARGTAPRFFGSLQLPAVTVQSPLAQLPSNEQLSFATREVYPPLQEQPTAGGVDAEDADGGTTARTSRGQSMRDGVGCSFAASSLVPAGTKPPVVGLVTNKNLCRGRFALWRYEELSAAHLRAQATTAAAALP